MGSFVNALVWRLHQKRNWITDRSVCTHCGHQLAVRDLVPVFSWLVLKGRCRYCSKKIEDNPLVEIFTALLFVFSYIYWPQDLGSTQVILFSFWLVFLVGFMALAAYDLKWLLLPNSIIYTLLVLAATQITWLAIADPGVNLLKESLLGLLVGGGIFYLLFQISKGKWIGGGDVKLGALLGLLVGGPLGSFLMLFLASLLGSAASMPLLITKRATRGTRLPFGPFLILAAIIVRLFGAAIIDWYKNQLLL